MKLRVGTIKSGHKYFLRAQIKKSYVLPAKEAKKIEKKKKNLKKKILLKS